MIALSIRQPWAWLILRPDLKHAEWRAAVIEAGVMKDIENRTWSTEFRGRVLVHAGKGCTRAEYAGALEFAHGAGVDVRCMPGLKSIERGGIVGSVEIVDCVSESDSRWFCGEFGFVLRDSRPMPFRPWPGQLQFFDVPRSVLPAQGAEL